MNDEMKTEIEKSAQYIEMSVEDATKKFQSICEENDVETTADLAKGLWRNYVAQFRRQKKVTASNGGSSTGGLVKAAFGFFISLEAPRDMMSWNRNKAKEEYLRNNDKALEEGFVAVATENALGKWVISRYHKNEYQEKIVSNLPEGAEELEDGTMIIPLDSQATYMSGSTNKNYGKPLPLEQFRRSGLFYGSIDGGEKKLYNFSYKNQPAIDFAPNCFEWIYFACIPSEDGSAIYGMTKTTLNSLVKHSDTNPEADNYEDVSGFDFEQCLVDNLSSHLVPLVEVDRAHIQRQTLPSKERFIVTDGTVCNMNMSPTSNGNRIINITDLNAEFDYDGDSNMTTCWIPNHLVIDFGIGSSIIVIGRTSQRIVDGEADPVTINVAGLYVVQRTGSPVEVDEIVEENLDWF